MLLPDNAPATAATAVVPPSTIATSPRMRSSAARRCSSMVCPPLTGGFGERRPAAEVVLVHRPTLEREVAGVLMLVRTGNRRQQRLVDIALAIDEAGAARMEAASRRRGQWARDVAGEHDLLPWAPERRVGDRRCGQERARVGMLRLCVQVVPGAGLNRLPEVHDHY